MDKAEKGLKDENSMKDHKHRTVKGRIGLKRVSRIMDRTVEDLKDGNSVKDLKDEGE